MIWRAFEATDLWPFTPLKSPSALSNPIDPYAIWASVTGFRGFTSNSQFRRPPGESWVSFIAEARSADDLDTLLVECERPERWMYVPNAYADPARRIQAGLQGTLHFTGRVRVSDLWRLNQNPAIVRWEMGLAARAPVEAGEFEGGFESRALFDNVGSGRRRSRAKETNERNRINDSASADPDGMPPEAVLKAKGVICVIDFGVAIFNQSFASDRGTRVACLWDQHQRGKFDGWNASFGFGYGRVLTCKSIDELRAQRPGDDEVELYRSIGYLQQRAGRDRPLKRVVHGTHVLDVAGGRKNPWHRVDASVPEDDAASRAWLHFVHLPIQTAVDSSGGSLQVHVLDGVRDALLRYPPGVPLMVVLSQGTHAGPHDGSTLLERALDELLEARRRDFAIVIGAGNGGLDRGRQVVGCHAVQTAQKDAPARFRIHAPDGDSTETFVEVWYASPARGTEIKVRVLPPSPTAMSEWVKPGQSTAALDDGAPVAMLVHAAQTPGGADAMILLALAPTWAPNAPKVPSGEWVLEVQVEGDAAVELHAWVERDDPLRGSAPDWPRFIGEGVSEKGTVNTLATGRHSLVAGALIHQSGAMAPYSAQGPLRGAQVNHPVPTVLVAADQSAARLGVLAAAVRSGESHRMSGTSVAAPTLARMLFNQMMASTPVERDGWMSKVKQIVADHPRLARRV